MTRKKMAHGISYHMPSQKFNTLLQWCVIHRELTERVH